VVQIPHKQEFGPLLSRRPNKSGGQFRGWDLRVPAGNCPPKCTHFWTLVAGSKFHQLKGEFGPLLPSRPNNVTGGHYMGRRIRDPLTA